MQDKETKLIEKLIDDKAFLTKFSENKSLEEQLKFLKENGFNFSEVEFKDFIKSLEEAYVSSENMSEEDLENVSGGKMQMRSKIAAAALVFSALGAGSMMGQASAGWSDWLPHNLIISAYNWMFSSSDGDGQGNAAATSAQSETSQQRESKPASMSGSSTERSELASSSTSGNSSQRSKSIQPSLQVDSSKGSQVSANARQSRLNSDPDTRTSVAQPSAASSAPQAAPSVSTEDADETLRGLKEELERLDKEIKSIRSGSPDLEKDERLSDEEKGAIQADYVSQLGSLEKQYKETAALIRKMEQERKRESEQRLKETVRESRRSVSTISMAAAAAPVVAQPSVASSARQAAPSSALTKDADETLHDLKEVLERLGKEIESIRSGSPDLEKDESLSDDEKGVIQTDYVSQLESLEKQYKETAALIRKMEKERKNESKQRSKRRIEKRKHPVSTTSMAAAAAAAAVAAPVATTAEQSEERGAAIAAAELIDLKDQKAKLEQERITTLLDYLGPKVEGETDADYEKRGCEIFGSDFAAYMAELNGEIKKVDSQIRAMEKNLRESGQLAFAKSMEAQHSGIVNLGCTCYFNTALQVLTQESAKDTVTGKNFKEAILELMPKQNAECPVLNALSDFFTAYGNESVDGANLVSRGTIQRIYNVLKRKNIVDQSVGVQLDTTETLRKIIEECINECRGKPELARLKGAIERLFAVVDNQDFVYRNSEDRLISGSGQINFVEYFHGGLVEGASKNIVIPFNRSSLGGTRRGQFDYTEKVLTSIQSLQQALRELGEQGRNFLESHKGATVFPAGASTVEQKLEHLYNSKSPKDKEEMVKEMIGVLLSRRDQVVIDGATYVNHNGKVCRRTPKYTGNIKVKNPIEIKESIIVNGRNYRLKAISIHKGTTGESGHYYAYVRSSINPDVWLCHNDASVSQRFGPIIEDPEVKCHQEGEEITDTESLITDPYVKMNATNLVYELVKE